MWLEYSLFSSFWLLAAAFRSLMHAKHVCGMSIVDSDFERLKRYNISEIFDPTPKESADKIEKADVK